MQGFKYLGPSGNQRGYIVRHVVSIDEGVLSHVRIKVVSKDDEPLCVYWDVDGHGSVGTFGVKLGGTVPVFETIMQRVRDGLATTGWQMLEEA